MSDKNNESLNPQAEPGAASGGSAGALLRAARESQGLTLAAVASTLKVPLAKLEALEADRLELLSDRVFARGLASGMCRLLRIDPVPVLAALPQFEAPRIKTDETGLNTPFKDEGQVVGHLFKTHWFSPIKLGILVLLVGIVAVLLWPRMSPPLGQAPSAPQVTQEASEAASAVVSEPVQLAAPAVAPVASGTVIEQVVPSLPGATSSESR